MTRLPIKVKEKAFNLRHRGYSVKEIADKLDIAKSTSSLWVRHIKLNGRARQRLLKRKLLKYYKGSLTWQKKRIKEEKQREFLALRIINNKIKRDSIHLKLYCSLLYWGEGGKGDKEAVRFINSDPILIDTFLKLFRKAFSIDEKKFRVLMHLHEYHNEKMQKNFWSNLTKIPKNQFLKTFHKPHTKKRIRKNYPGCVVIYYHDLKVARELRTFYKIFSKQLGTW